MKRTPVQRLCEVKADHEGWEAEVAQMDSDVAYVFKDLRTWISRYEVQGYDGRILAVGHETRSEDVVKRAKRLGWVE